MVCASAAIQGQILLRSPRRDKRKIRWETRRQLPSGRKQLLHLTAVRVCAHGRKCILRYQGVSVQLPRGTLS